MRRITILRAASMALCLCAAPADAQTLAQVLAQLDRRTLEPGWIGNYAPAGVLHGQGWALWEMPESYVDAAGDVQSVDGGGYNHALRRLALDSTYYRSLMRPGVSSLLFDQQDLAEATDLGFRRLFSRLELVDMASRYNAGTSIALQNLVFSPIEAPSGQAPFWRYPELENIVRSASAAGIDRIYGNIGFANNNHFYQGEWRYNVEHGQHAAAPHIAWQLLFQAPANVSPTTYLEVRQPWDFSTTRLPRPDYVHAILDPLDPTVLSDCLASIRHMATTWADAMAFYVGGEFSVGLLEPKSPFAEQPELPPKTGYSPRAMAGFVIWLQRIYHDDIRRLNAAWQPATPFPSFQQVTPSAIGDPPRNPSPSVRDFEAYLAELAAELLLLQYQTGKAAARQGQYGLLSFGTRDIERSWMRSDFGTSGSWHDTEDEYFRALGNDLYYETAACRLAGTPTAFAIASPPTHEHACSIGSPTPPPFWQRCLTEAHARLLVHDVLAAGSMHIGYYKAPGGYATFGSSAADELQRAFADLKARQRDHLRFMTPYHRVHLHLDADSMSGWNGDPTLASTLSYLGEAQVPFAMVSEPSALERLFAKHMARRGVLVSHFHRDLVQQNAALFRSYRAMAASSPRTAIGVFADLPAAVSLLGGGHVVGMVPVGAIGSAFVLADPGLPCYLITFPTNAPPAAEMAAVLDALLHAIPEQPTQPIVLAGALPHLSRVHLNVVQDGLNFFVAVANPDRTQAATGLSLQVHPEVAARFAPAVSHWVADLPGPYTLPPRGTQYVLLRAVVPGTYTAADLSTELAVMLANLRTLEVAGFDVSHGFEQHAHAAAISAAALPSRVLAGILRLRQMIFLKVTRASANVTVEVRRHDGSPVGQSPVQLVYLSNAHEIRNVGSTDAAGVLQFAVGTSQSERWDFFSLAYGVPAQTSASDPIEVHVHDPVTGEQAFATK